MPHKKSPRQRAPGVGRNKTRAGAKAQQRRGTLDRRPAGKAKPVRGK